MEIENWKIDAIDLEILESIIDVKLVHDGGLSIILYAKNHEVKINYSRFSSYRYADEAYLLNYWDYFTENKLEGLVFFKVFQSSYLEEIKTLSKKFFTDGGGESIEHHAIFTKNECFEILSDSSPEITVSKIRYDS